MSRKSPFNGSLRQRLAGLWGSARHYGRAHPKTLVLAMLLLLSVAVAGLLRFRHLRQESYAASGERLRRQLPAAAGKGQVGRSNARDLLELVRLYQAARLLNPDSLSGRDSALMKNIDQRLNRIIHEEN